MSAVPRGKKKKTLRKTAKPQPRKAVRRAPRQTAPYADFMVQAYMMENDARDRYSEFADQMEVHNNLEVAQLFRRLARIEGLHA